ncbi:RRP15-like protein [Camponotus floridanus]|nr:RRP15-like protein [Camponotus floridanus]
MNLIEMNESDTESLHDAKSTSNTGWADVMQKILRTNKPKRKKTIVLAKAKKLCDVKVKEKKEDISFEIDGSKNVTEIEEASVKTGEHAVHTKPKIKEKNLGIRVKPSITDQEREKMLQKIATRGVVQLFNAVKQQQTDISKKLTQAGPLERKREQVLKSIDKNAFLDILMGGSKSISIDNTVQSEKVIEQTNNKNKDDKIWSVLRDDFVMGAKLKDWDKKDVEEEDSSAPEDMNSDMD